MRAALVWTVAILTGVVVAWAALALILHVVLTPFIRLAYLLGG